ncbi:N-acetyl sugar amidotransferase [Pseudodesulfovibrio sp. F-1]|uniref:N-acetyl sugar amidotransferase n=2 Tax=Pseudodesulfovibrio alkaliphilus TaxID=2661613 RepID=A0A7K1KLL3_9BACT|nr:N-acetyl sugar amidotransferase [Pseudodesulfovibrio alkaliphilus]MUM76955.1 N-acetyl sugar amidotransferase [Pseudodesulfovibrio alkaliphilus]
MSNTIRYCTKCVMPETKPDLWFDEDGVCAACKYFDERDEIDWEARKKELETIVEQYRSKDGSNYDCVIPCSGGKDSTFQTLTMLDMGLNPLCVTATTDRLSDIGRRNIENIKNLGVDYIEVTTNPVIRRKINKLCLEQVGDISWPEHLTIFTIPVRIAVQMNIPLIVWGENSQNENGGPATDAENPNLTRRWLEEFGGLLGLRVTDLVDQEGIEKKHLIPYTYPSDEELARVGVTGIFLGYYKPWDGLANALVAAAHGFESNPTIVEGSIVNYENLDNQQMRIHDYFKFLKYGYSRPTDWACWHIRRGRLSREQGLKLVKKHEGKFPWKYLGCDLATILDEIGMTLDEFKAVCDRFTNKKIFKVDRRGNLVRDGQGDLIRLNDDNV